jgi:hypothetical protein
VLDVLHLDLLLHRGRHLRLVDLWPRCLCWLWLRDRFA